MRVGELPATAQIMQKSDSQPLISPVGICGYRMISSKENRAIRPVCTNLRLNSSGVSWGANSCYDIRLDINECPFTQK